MFHAKFVINCTGCWSSLSHTRCSSTGHWPRLLRAWAQQVKFYIFIQFKLYGPDTLEWTYRQTPLTDFSCGSPPLLSRPAWSGSAFTFSKWRSWWQRWAKGSSKSSWSHFRLFPSEAASWCQAWPPHSFTLLHGFSFLPDSTGDHHYHSLDLIWPVQTPYKTPAETTKMVPNPCLPGTTCNNKGPTLKWQLQPIGRAVSFKQKTQWSTNEELLDVIFVAIPLFLLLIRITSGAEATLSAIREWLQGWVQIFILKY